MVGHEDDRGGPATVALAEGGQDLTDAVVQVADGRVVGAAGGTHLGAAQVQAIEVESRPQLPGRLVERHLRRRRCDRIVDRTAPVAVPVRSGDVERVVWMDEGHGQRKGPIPVAWSSEPPDRPVGHLVVVMHLQGGSRYDPARFRSRAAWRR